MLIDRKIASVLLYMLLNISDIKYQLWYIIYLYMTLKVYDVFFLISVYNNLFKGLGVDMYALFNN